MKSLIFAHIGIIVPNVEEGLKQYSSIFGPISAPIYTFKPLKSCSYNESINDCELKISLGEVISGLKIELIEPTSPDTPHSEFLKNTGGGMHHVAYQTDEYDWWLDYFNQRKIGILFEAEVEDEVRGYRRCAYVDLGFKHIIELFSTSRRLKN